MSDSSSENSAVVETPVETQAPESDVKTPEPSPGEQGVEANPLLDVVEKALKPQAVESPATRDGKVQAQPETTSEGKAADELADTGKYPKNAQGRIRFLNDEVKAKEAEITRLAPVVDLGNKILDAMDRYEGLDAADLENTLHLTGLIKSGNYGQALQAITPIFQELQKRAGEVLPADLAQKVKLGHITPADAKALHKANTELANRQAQDAEQQKRTEAQKQIDAHATIVRKSATAVSEWERGKAAADPDWHLKLDPLKEGLELEVRRFREFNRGRFPTDKESVTLAEKVLAAVEKRLKAFAPKPQARAVTSGQPASTRSQAAPKSPMEALEAGLALAKRAA